MYTFLVVWGLTFQRRCIKGACTSRMIKIQMETVSCQQVWKCFLFIEGIDFPDGKIVVTHTGHIPSGMMALGRSAPVCQIWATHRPWHGHMSVRSEPNKPELARTWDWIPGWLTKLNTKLGSVLPLHVVHKAHAKFTRLGCKCVYKCVYKWGPWEAGGECCW